MAACFLYNAWVIPFRYIFCEYQTANNYHIWFIIDYMVVDLLYVLDMVIFKYRLPEMKIPDHLTPSRVIFCACYCVVNDVYLKIDLDRLS